KKRTISRLSLKVPVVELRYFGGLTVEEVADALDISPATVKRHWTLARAFLKKELAPDASRRSRDGEGG
ncbi:MAG TPA: ECF-type sigma factor, partial [Vicinamibacterales bacterium]|nr:ECF-type sigma factor [Vicinamibacterales bacterium]